MEDLWLFSAHLGQFSRKLAIFSKKVAEKFAGNKKMPTFAIPNEKNGSPAEVAQLVEHNLAKVGVASSSLVFRSKTGHLRMTLNFEKELRLKKISPDGVQSYVSRPCAQGGFFVYIP